MLKLIVSLFEPKKPEKKERKLRPLRLEVSTNDAFGKALQQYNDNLLDSEKDYAKKLFRLLIKVGSSSEPPEYWHRLFRRHGLLIENRNLIVYSKNWWTILLNQFSNITPLYWHGPYQVHCTIDNSNIPIARGIIWLYLHTQKQRSVNDLVQFISVCQKHRLHRPLVCNRLAHASLDAIFCSSYTMQSQRDLLYYYPNLADGRIGQRLKLYWNRK